MIRSYSLLYRPISIMLLFYLLLAILFPSYQGFEDGQEFHFFGIEPNEISYQQHTKPVIESLYEREHSHSLLLFYPSYQSRHKYKTGESAKSFLPEAIDLCLNISEYPGTKILPAILHAIYLYANKTSGLSPPVI